MPTPHLASSQLPSHNAAVVIRERIKEKRLFEAQFLFGLLDEDDIPAEERQALERELDGLLAVVRDLQLQANKYIAEGEYVLARKMHREMERIAVDVPGLEYGKRQVEAQDQAARKAVADPTPVPEATRPKNEPGPEFQWRLAGDSYMSIMERGGGIASTMRATRAESEDELKASARRHLSNMMKMGITTVEAKSGYGMNLETELKQLRVVRDLQDEQPLDLYSTFMGAHDTAPYSQVVSL